MPKRAWISWPIGHAGRHFWQCWLYMYYSQQLCFNFTANMWKLSLAQYHVKAGMTDRKFWHCSILRSFGWSCPSLHGIVPWKSDEENFRKVFTQLILLMTNDWSKPMGFAIHVRSAGQKYGPKCHQRDRADVTEFVTLVRLSSLGQHVGVLALAGYKRRKSALAAGPILRQGMESMRCSLISSYPPSVPTGSSLMLWPSLDQVLLSGMHLHTHLHKICITQ